MKSTSEKVALVIAILIIILVISGIVGGVFLVKKLMYKDSITGEKFVSVMEDNSFYVVDIKERLDDSYFAINEAYVAKKDEYQVEFYTFKNDEAANYFYETNKKKNDSNTVNTKIDFKGENYAVFNIETKTKYKFLEIIDKAVIYINADKEYKDSVKDIVKKLGY